MNKLHEAFCGGKAFVPFITCGDPDLETTAANIKEAVENGADLIALGIPFSDPTAEAPVLQEASIRALSGGVNTDGVFGFLRELRETISVPVVLVTYANVVFSYGVERFAAACREADVDGVMISDLPFEEHEDFIEDFGKYGVELISQIALTSEDRIEMIAKEAKGFICITATICGGLGREAVLAKLKEIVGRVRGVTDTPCVVEFNADGAAEAGEVAAMADGVLVGPAIVQLQAEFGKNAPQHIGQCVGQMKNAMK